MCVCSQTSSHIIRYQDRPRCTETHGHRAVPSDVHTGTPHTDTGTFLLTPVPPGTEHRLAPAHRPSSQTHTDTIAWWQLVSSPHCVPGAVLSSLHALSCLIPTLVFRGRDDGYPHCTGEETEVWRGAGLGLLQGIVELGLQLRAACPPGLGSELLGTPAS